MKILEDVYDQLLRLFEVPPECGGIMGSHNGDVISEIIIDKGISTHIECAYTPNIIYLNQALSEWAERGIIFKGMFHTHAPQWSTLSEKDEEYIISIISAMPSYINQLFFPIIFPRIGIKGYKVVREFGEIKIVNESIEVINL